MKVLIVASYNYGKYSPFVSEQAESVKGLNIQIDYFPVKGKGVFGYLKNRKGLLKKIEEYHPDIIHAHYGLSGLLANLQREVPVVTTFHGSDIHSEGIWLLLSKICMYLSAFNIFVSRRIYETAKYKKSNYAILPCGTDAHTFFELPKDEARNDLGWEQSGKYVLFAGAFENKVKNYALAQKAVTLVNGCQLIELKGYDRVQVNLLMNACDCLLMTSDKEASPMVIKEAMLCGCPIISVDVGDVKDMISGIVGCFIARREPEDIADKLLHIFELRERTDGRNRIIQSGLDLSDIARRIQTIYEDVCRIHAKNKYVV